MAQWLSCSSLCKKFNYFLLFWLAYNTESGATLRQRSASGATFRLRSASVASLRQCSVSGVSFRLAFRTALLFVSHFEPCYSSPSLVNGATFHTGRRYIYECEVTVQYIVTRTSLRSTLALLNIVKNSIFAFFARAKTSVHTRIKSLFRTCIENSYFHTPCAKCPLRTLE